MKNIFTLLLIITYTIVQASTLDTPFKKSLEHTFSVQENTTVDLRNKFGKIDLKTWDKSQVLIKVTIKVEAKSQEKANEIFDRISVSFEEESDRVSAVTNIEKRSSGWGGLFGKSNSCNSEEFSIDWEVFMPAKNKLDLSNKYGDTFIALMQSDLDIDISYGDVKMEGTNQYLDLKVAYGGGSVTNIIKGKADIMYGSLRAGYIGDAKVDVQYSEIYVDEWGIGEMDVAYGTLTMKKLKGNIELDLAYSDGVIKEVASTTTKIDLDIAYGDLKVDLNDLEFYGEFDSVYGDITVPNGFTKTKNKEGSFSNRFRGYSNTPNKGIEIMGDVAYGDLIIR